ncbi:hypothetical protein F5146DRAFT_1155456 [Armillaria mellea]|nr:hypothetical protein F5146DRAFT_1155456 [Armillaria mellea]
MAADASHSMIMQTAAATKLLQSLSLHNHTRLTSFPLLACSSLPSCLPVVSESDSPGEIVTITGVWAGFGPFIQDLAQSLLESFHRGMARLPEAIFKAVHHLAYMESQKRVELVEALVYWHLVDELMQFEGINEGQFSVDYDVTFKPMVKLTQWVAHLKDWPSVLLGALQSQESSRSHMSLPCLPEGATLSAEQKELWQDLLAACSWTRRGHLSYWQKVLHLIEGVAWQLRWMRCTWGNPKAYGNKLQMFAIEMGMSELWQQVQGSMSTVAARNKDAIVALIQCVTVSPLILFKWNKDATSIPMQSLLYACSFDDQEKLVVLKNVEKGLWSLLVGVAGGAFEPEEGLGAAHAMQISPWFDVAARLKPPRGSKTASIQVAPDAVTHVESTVLLLSTSNNNEDASAVEDEHAVAGGLEEAEDVQIAVADNGMVGAVTVFCEDLKTKANADADESPSEEERVPKKRKKKTKKKSQDLASEDDDVEELRAVSSTHTFKHYKPPPFRLSKSELKVYADNGADDEDYAWRQGFLQASRTKGPVMDAVRRLLRIKRSVAPCVGRTDPFERGILESLVACRTDKPGDPPPWLECTDGPLRVAHLRYSEHLPILPLLRERSMLVTDVPPHAKNWGWNLWTARELGDLDMPIQVHESVRCVTDSSDWLTKPTMEITSSLRTVLEEGLKGNKGRILNALTLPMPDTTLQSPLFFQAASHLDACKDTQSIGSDLLGTSFPAAALSWGLASNAGTVTPPHMDFGGSAIKIDVLTGCKVWFVISKRQEDKRGETWDMFVHDFQADSKVNSEVYKCEILLLEPGMLWFQRLNTLHAVAIQANSLVFGQHFFPASAIRSVVMGWVHTAFLSWAITNVEHKDMRILLLCIMAHWKKVITAGEPLEGMDGSNDVYELYMAVKLSALQFGLALLDYHTSVADSPLYEALDSGDWFNRIWFRSNVLGEQQKKRRQPEDNLFWDIPFSISTVEAIPDDVHIISYDELPPIEEETDSSASSPLTDMLESEPLQSPPPAPAMMLVSMASPSRKALAKHPETIIVANLASSQSEDATSAVEEDIWRPTTKRSCSIEWSEHEHSDILVGSKTPRPLKQSKSTKSINNWNTSEQEAQDEEQNADYEDEDVGDDSDDEEHQADNDADTNGSNGAFLDNLESTSQAMWQANDEERDDSIEDDGWQVQEEWESLSLGTEFDLALATIEVNEATDREIEETPPDAVMTSEGAPQTTGWLRCPSGPKGEFDGGRLEDDFNHFLNPDAFAQGETDEGVLRDIEHEPLAHIHSLDMPGEISHLAKESSKVLHLSQTVDLMALISTTSHSLMTSLPMPQALIDDLFQMSVSSGASKDVADAVSEDEFHDVIEVSSEEENAQPELPEELMLWWEQMKTTLWDYLKDKQPLGAIEVEESAQCDMLQHESLEELVLGCEQRRKELLNDQKDGKPLGPIEVEEGTPCNLLQCVSNVLDTNLESCWRFDGVFTPLEKKSLKRLMKMGKSWLNDGMVAITLEVLCQGYPSWGTAEPLALASLNAASKAFKNIMKAHTELGKSDFVLPIHQDRNHWILFHLNIPSQRMELLSRFAHAVSDLEHPFEFIVSKSKAKEREEDNWERWDCCVRFAQGRGWNSIKPPTCSNSNETEETLFPRPEACPNVARHEMSQQGAIMDDNDNEEDFKEDEFGFDDNDSEPTSTISNEETEEHEGNSERRVGHTDPMPPMQQANINRNWGMYNLPAGSLYDNMVATSTDRSGIRRTPLGPAVPSRTASGVTLPCNGVGHSHSRTSPVAINLQSAVFPDGSRGLNCMCTSKVGPYPMDRFNIHVPIVSQRQGKECPDTTTVLEQTQLSRADLYILYIHKTLSGEGELPELPMVVASTVVNSTAPSTMVSKGLAAWAIWDHMFLVSVSSAGSLFDKAYDEPFKIYAAVNILMGIAHKINKFKKKPLTMGRGGRLPQVLSWLKARVGKHQVAIFDRSQKMFERYLTFWNWAQQMSQELSRLEMGGVNLDSEQSNMFHMLKVWQEVPARVAEPDAEPLTDDELHYLQ